MAECNEPSLGSLRFDLFFSKIIESRTYLVYYFRLECQISCMDASLDVEMSLTNLGHCDFYL